MHSRLAAPAVTGNVIIALEGAAEREAATGARRATRKLRRAGLGTTYTVARERTRCNSGANFINISVKRRASLRHAIPALLPVPAVRRPPRRNPLSRQGIIIVVVVVIAVTAIV